MLSGTPVVPVIADGLVYLTSGNAIDPPRHFTATALDDLKRMRGLFSGREHADWIEFSSNGGPVAIVDAHIAEKVDRIYKGAYTALGSIDGALDAVNMHGKVIVTIWDRVTGTPVRCYLPGDVAWKKRAGDLLLKRVIVHGLIRYFRNGVPQSVAQVSDLQEVRQGAPRVRGDFGSIPDITAGEDSVQFIRGRRE